MSNNTLRWIILIILALPGATILTLAAGAVFGLVEGVVVVSVVSSIRATLAFLASRRPHQIKRNIRPHLYRFPASSFHVRKSFAPKALRSTQKSGELKSAVG